VPPELADDGRGFGVSTQAAPPSIAPPELEGSLELAIGESDEAVQFTEVILESEEDIVRFGKRIPTSTRKVRLITREWANVSGLDAPLSTGPKLYLWWSKYQYPSS
jgi:hypothetical protein